MSPKVGKPHSLETTSWYWDEKTNHLAYKFNNPIKKSRIVNTICLQHQSQRKSIVHNRYNKEKTKDGSNLFKRTAEAAAKVVELGRVTINETNRVRAWSLDSAKKLALEEMENNFRNGKISAFSKKLQEKANRSSSGKVIGKGQYSIEKYFSILKKYINLQIFDTFALALVNFFSVLFELRQFEQSNNNISNSGKSPKDIKIQQLKANDLKLKQKSFEHKLGMAYASLLLGDNETRKYHHMHAGTRRLCSFTVIDQILGEMILEFCAMVVFLVFRADKTVTLEQIKIVLGKEMRTNHFNPYHHEKIAEKLENVKKFIVNPGKDKRNKDNYDPSLADFNTSGNDINYLTQSVGSLNSTMNYSDIDVNKTVLVPSHERAAVERRIKGNRPSIAAVIHQRSHVISAALKSDKELDKLNKRFRLQNNMISLNTQRQSTTKNPMTTSGRPSVGFKTNKSRLPLNKKGF